MRFVILLSIFVSVLLVACGDDDSVASSNSTKSEMIVVPADNDGVNFGSRTVASISSFMIGRNEVTYALWTNIVNWATSNGYTFTAGSGYMGDNVGDTPQHPVTYVSFNDILVWCNARSVKEGLQPVYYTDTDMATLYRNANDTTVKLVKTSTTGAKDCVKWSESGYRLPTEAEWEYAARLKADGTLSDRYKPSGYFGDATTSSVNVAEEWGQYAWYSGNSASTIHLIGQKKPNDIGAFDMSGNVNEWCWDWYDSFSQNTDADSRGIDSGTVRVLKGGSWAYNAETIASGYRGNQSPTYRNDRFGFRLARSVK